MNNEDPSNSQSPDGQNSPKNVETNKNDVQSKDSNVAVLNNKNVANSSNVSSIDAPEQKPSQFMSPFIIILTLLTAFIVGAVLFVHKKKLFAKEAKAKKHSDDVAAFNIMNTYQNVTPTLGYTDYLKQSKDNQPLDYYQNPMSSNSTPYSNNTLNYSTPNSNNTLNYSTHSNSPLLAEAPTPISVPDQAYISPIETNPSNYQNNNMYYNNRPMY